MTKILILLLFIASLAQAEEASTEVITPDPTEPTTKTDGGEVAPTAATPSQEVRVLTSLPPVEKVKVGSKGESADVKAIKEIFSKATTTENPIHLFNKAKPAVLKDIKTVQGWVGIRGSFDRETQKWGVAGSSILFIDPQNKEGSITYTPGLADFDSTPEAFVGKLTVASKMNLTVPKQDLILSLVENTPVFDHHEVTVRNLTWNGKNFLITQDAHKLPTGKNDPDLAVEYGIFIVNRITPTK